MLVRTWNVFHGNSRPPQRRSFLREAVALALDGTPDVVCLQELPAWSLSKLAAWSGYAAAADVAAKAMLGPLPSTAEVGRAITSLHPGLLRSAFSGQGNAILLAPSLALRERHLCVLNPFTFRRSRARQLGLGPVARLAWAKERRVCQVVRAWDGSRTLVVANLHATAFADRRLADAELKRAFLWVDGIARADEPVVVAGDFNITEDASQTLAELTGFSRPRDGIDQILVRGLEPVSGQTAWPEKRRVVAGALVSDHAPVDLEVR